MSRSKQLTPTDYDDRAESEASAQLSAAALHEVSGLYVNRNPKFCGLSEAEDDDEVSEFTASFGAESPASDERDESNSLADALAQAERIALGLPIQLRATELRLDVDGRYPQMSASGTLEAADHTSIHWIARLKPTKADHWVGSIWYTLPSAPTLPYTAVAIKVRRSVYHGRRRAWATFIGRGARSIRYSFSLESRYFHPVNFEFDQEVGANPVLEIDTGAHPNRPASLPLETLSLQNVFRRAGFDASVSPGNAIPTDGPDVNTTWSDAEMHDTMQVQWSRFANSAQWGLWVLYARQHDDGPGLGGVMFDSIGPNHRQGTAIFTDSFISEAPAGDANPAAWIARSRFWTAAHEMGHAFNLAHSWQKEHPPEWGTPWMPIPNEPEARSFMNYPYNVVGGDTAFFSDFEFRFSDPELLFMRHAPSQFVEMGNADWFDQHGFERSFGRPRSRFQLRLAVDRSRAVFQFLEPIVLELQLTNRGSDDAVIDANTLAGATPLTVAIARRGSRARQFVPFAKYCLRPEARRIRRDETVTSSLFVSAGLNGWDLAEPGEYVIQAALHLPEGDVISAPLRLRIATPRDFVEENIAQDYFTQDVGRVLAFDGSRRLSAANDALREVTAKLPDHPAAIHARVALAMPRARPYRVLKEDGTRFVSYPAEPEAARVQAEEALLRNQPESSRTLGRIDYVYYAEHLAKAFDRLGDKVTAKSLTAVVSTGAEAPKQAAE